MLARTERAVGVDADGRVMGVTSYERLRDAIRTAEDEADAADSGRLNGQGQVGAADQAVAGGITT